MKEQARAAPMREISPAGNKGDKTNPVKRKRPVAQKGRGERRCKRWRDAADSRKYL